MAGVQMSADLKYVLDEKAVPQEYQTKLVEQGVTSLATFAYLDDDRTAIRAMLRAEWGFTPEADPKSRVNQAAFIAAWEEARTRMAKERDEAAQSHMSKVPRVLPAGDHLGMRRAFEARHHALTDEVAPSDALVEMRLDMFEAGEQRAESLRQVTTRAQDDGTLGHDTSAEVDRSGLVRVKKAPKPIPLPSNTEELRLRLRTWGASWMFAAMRHPGREALGDITPQGIYDYIEYLLGPDVYGLTVKDSRGHVISRPPFNLIVEYDHAVRKRVAKYMNDGEPFAAALRRATADGVTRERHFLTPLMVSAVECRERERSRTPRRPPAKSSSGRAAASTTSATSAGGGKPRAGKGKGGASPATATCKVSTGPLMNKTPDGRMICFAHNRGGCKTSRCKFVHVCRVCFGTDHIPSGGGAPAKGSRSDGGKGPPFQ